MAAKRLLCCSRQLLPWTTRLSTLHGVALWASYAHQRRWRSTRSTQEFDKRRGGKSDETLSWVDLRSFTPQRREEPPFPSTKPYLRVSENGIEHLQRFTEQYAKIPGVWLRDNCACHECRNQDTAQRKVNVFKIWNDCEVAKVDVDREGPSYEVTFKDGHKSTFSEGFLLRLSSRSTEHKRIGDVPQTLWNHEIGAAPPTVRYAETQSDGLGLLLLNIREYGFCFVEGIDPTPEATENFLSSIGPITNTHYGGFYDFTADLSSKDTAYTNESLEPHNDNSYFTAAAGLQALHLLSHTEGSGGESSLVDGFAVAQEMYTKNRPAYSELSRIAVWGHASGNDGISIQPAHARSVFEHSYSTKTLLQVTWNNADRAGIGGGYGIKKKWYDAAAVFDALISDPKNQYWFRLEPGKLLIFDNWRVLHGRAAFTGKRRMCGGYIARDDFISKFKATNMRPEEIQASTVTG